MTDWPHALSAIYAGATDDPLASYRASTQPGFFTVGNWLKINLSDNPAASNICSGTCSIPTSPITKAASPAHTLTNGTNLCTCHRPPAPEQTLPSPTDTQYVFQQGFRELAPAGAADDAGLMKDDIWEWPCRGRAAYGFSMDKAPGRPLFRPEWA